MFTCRSYSSLCLVFDTANRERAIGRAFHKLCLQCMTVAKWSLFTGRGRVAT